MSDDSVLPVLEQKPLSEANIVINQHLEDQDSKKPTIPELKIDRDFTDPKLKSAQVEVEADTELDDKEKALDSTPTMQGVKNDDDADQVADADAEAIGESDDEAVEEFDVEVVADSEDEEDEPVTEIDAAEACAEGAEVDAVGNAKGAEETNAEANDDLDPDPNTARDIEHSSDEISDDLDEINVIRLEENADSIYTIFLIIWTLIVTLAVFIFGIVPYMFLFREIIGPQHPLKLIPRSTWDATNGNYQYVSQLPYLAQRIAILQTDTEQCETLEDCAELILNIERDYPMMKYNFVVSRDGNVFEGLGWTEPSPMYIEKPTMVVAFIGDYEYMEPSAQQLEQLKILLAESIEMNYLSMSYTMVGRKLRGAPTKLFEALYEWEQWNGEDSDSDEVSIDFEPFLIDLEYVDM